MNARFALIVALALLSAFSAGCRTDPAIPLLERENFLLENRVYDLEDALKRCQRELGECRGQPIIVEAPAGGQAAESASPPRAAPRRPAAEAGPEENGGAFAPPTRRVPPARPKPEITVPPRVEPGKPVPEGTVPDRFKVEAAAPPKPAPSGPVGHGAAPPPRPAPAASNTQVAQISLNRQFTCGYNADGQPGDEGIMASIEPRDSAGNVVSAAAPISVVVLDPAEQGQAARVARWDFSAAEIAAMVQSMRLADGIHLAMTWPGAAPRHERLHLFVRYTTDDGRKLEANTPIEVTTLGRQARAPRPAISSAPPTARPLRPDPAPAAPASPPVVAEESGPPPAVEAPVAPHTAARAEPPAAASPPAKPARKRPVWSPNRM